MHQPKEEQILIDAIEFNHKPTKFYFSQMERKKLDKMDKPQTILGFAHLAD